MAGASSSSKARLDGNSLFKRGLYAEARAAYTAGLDAREELDRDKEAVLLANRAACALHLHDADAAAADCYAALKLNPCHPKANFRLAKALAQSEPMDQAAVQAIAAASALKAAVPAEEVDSVYASIRSAFGHLLPADRQRLRCAGSTDELARWLWNGFEHVVVRPGRYSVALRRDLSRHALVIGLGEVELIAPSGHAVLVRPGGSCTLFNVRLVGRGVAAVCVTGSPQEQEQALLRMLRCRVTDYDEVGVLVCGESASAELEACVFSRLSLQAIEVRNGGSLTARGLTITHCQQGVLAYGGARKVHLEDCRLLHSRAEGLLLSGPHRNAATKVQQDNPLPTPKPQSCREQERLAIGESARQHGFAQGNQLDALITGCTIANSGNFGVSIDTGARVSLLRCRLENNDGFAVIIKGGSDLCIAASHILFTGERSNAPFCRGHGRPVRQGGVLVAVNYDGDVSVLSSALVGPSQLALQEEMAPPNSERRAKHAEALGPKAVTKKLGMWSKPMRVIGEQHFVAREADAPTRERLAQHLPAQVAPESSRPQRTPVQPSAPTLWRICHPLARSMATETAGSYYAIGNTPGFDVTAGLLAALIDDTSVDDVVANETGTSVISVRPSVDAPISPPEADAAPGAAAAPAAGARQCVDPQPDGEAPANTDIRVLFAACGDIRNLAHTVHSVFGDGGHGGRRLDVFMNDINLCMLARDVVLLHMTAELHARPEAVLAVWASHGLTEAHGTLLKQSLRALADAQWPTWLSASASLDGGGDADLQERMRQVFSSWASCTTPLSDVLTTRAEAMDSFSSSKVLELSLSRVAESTAVDAKRREELQHYIGTGSLKAPGVQHGSLVQPNWTFLTSPTLQYEVYPTSSIFRAVSIDTNIVCDVEHEHKKPTLYTLLLRTLASQLASLSQALSSGKLRITCVVGDALILLTTTRSDTCFHYIDCSNLADYVSIPALVQAAAPVILPSPYARLWVESMRLFRRNNLTSPESTPDSFIRTALGIPRDAFEGFVGLSLQSSRPLSEATDSCKVLRMEWAPSHKELETSWRSPVTILLELLSASQAFLDPCTTGTFELTGPCSPLTMTHLLLLAVGRKAAIAFADLLISFEPLAKKSKWALKMPHLQDTMLRLCMYDVQLSLRAWAGRGTETVLKLVLSRKPMNISEAVSSEAISQVISTFHWDEDFGRLTVLLPASILDLCGSWHLTLCAVQASARLVALGHSMLLSSHLPVHSSETAAQAAPWRLPRPFSPDVDATFMQACNKSAAERAAAGWCFHVHAPHDRVLCVDVAAPGPLPSSKAAVLSVHAARRELFIALEATGKLGRKGAAGNVLIGARCTIQLPVDVPEAASQRIKASEHLGLIAIKLSLPAANNVVAE